MTRILRAALMTTALSGCAAFPPPGTPTPSQIAGFSNAVMATNLSPVDYLNYGLTAVERNCSMWFGDQVSGARHGAELQQLLAIAAGAAAAAGGPAGASTAAGVALGSAALGVAQSNAQGGAMPAVVYGVVKKQLQAYVSALPPPVSLADAAALIEGAAEYCQGPSIASAVITALTTAQAVPATYGMRARGGRVTPPVIAIMPPPGQATSPPYVSPQSLPGIKSRAVSRPKVKPATDPEPLARIPTIRLIVVPEVQRKADEEWRDRMDAVIARWRAEQPQPIPLHTPDPVVRPEPSQEVPAPRPRRRL